MTTTVTVKTHDWPVAAIITDKYGESATASSELVLPNSERAFYLTDSRSIAFHEMPKLKAAE